MRIYGDCSEPLTGNDASFSQRCSIFAFCYLCAFFCYGIGYEISITSFASRFPQESAVINLSLQVIALALLVIKILVQRYDIKRMLIVVLLSIPLLLGSLSSDNYSTLWLVLFAISAQGITLRDIATTGFAATLIVVVGTIFLALLGVLDNTPYYRSDGTVRYALGFAHPNSLGVCVMQACICLLVLGFGRVRLAHYAFMVLAALTCLFVCDSRTESFAVLLILACAVMSTKKYFREKHAIVCVLAFAATLAAAVLSLYFMAFYNPSNALHSMVNDMLSYRLNYAHYYFETYPPSLFGQASAEISEFSSIPLDNSWCKELEVHGAISIAYILILELCIFLKARKSAVPGSLPYVILVYAFVSLSETIAFHIFFNISLIAITSTVFAASIDSFDDSAPESSFPVLEQGKLLGSAENHHNVSVSL